MKYVFGSGRKRRLTKKDSSNKIEPLPLARKQSFEPNQNDS